MKCQAAVLSCPYRESDIYPIQRHGIVGIAHHKWTCKQSNVNLPYQKIYSNLIYMTYSCGIITSMNSRYISISLLRA